MNDAHISAQIETLQMALDRILNDCDKMQIELGRLKAGMAPAARPECDHSWIRPLGYGGIAQRCKKCGDEFRPAVEPWQTEDVQPVTGGRPIKCVGCGNEVAAWDDLGNRGWYCLTCRTTYEETGRSL